MCLDGRPAGWPGLAGDEAMCTDKAGDGVWSVWEWVAGSLPDCHVTVGSFLVVVVVVPAVVVVVFTHCDIVVASELARGRLVLLVRCYCK